MTDWTARIDALPPRGRIEVFMAETGGWRDIQAPEPLQARLALAAERLREPHGYNCRALWSLTAPDCTCGLVADLLRILEGK